MTTLNLTPLSMKDGLSHTQRAPQFHRNCKQVCTWLGENGFPGYEWVLGEQNDKHSCYGHIQPPNQDEEQSISLFIGNGIMATMISTWLRFDRSGGYDLATRAGQSTFLADLAGQRANALAAAA